MSNWKSVMSLTLPYGFNFKIFALYLYSTYHFIKIPTANPYVAPTKIQ